MKRYIIYHDDPDGRCAAAIAGRAAQKLEMDPVYIRIEHGMPLPEKRLKRVERRFDELWVVDFSFPLDDMKRLLDIFNGMVWIDHHGTAIEAMKPLAGLMDGYQSTDMAACFIAWHQCNVGIHTPLPVRLIADYDLWQFDYGDRSKYFHAAQSLFETDPSREIWDEWFGIYEIDPLNALLDYGKAIYDSRIREHRRTVVDLGREENIFGTEKRVMTVNAQGCGDLGATINRMGFDVAHCYADTVISGRLVRKHRLYSETVDVADWAQQKGGGGHKHAAGWTEVLG